MKKGFCRRKALSLALAFCLALPGTALAAEPEPVEKVTVQGYQETDASEFYGLFTHSDSEVTVTVKNDAKQNGNGWEQAGFTHAGRPVVQSSAESGKYAGLALEVSRPCYLVYDYTLASKSSSSLYHKTAANLTKTSGTTSYTNLSSSGARSDYQDEGEVAAGAWKTAVVDLTDANTSNRVLWLEHYRSSSDKNPIARAYVSNLRFYESLESLPEAYKATVDFRFNPEHGYVESKYYSKKTNIETPSVLVFPIYSKLSLYFRYEEEIDVQGWKVTDSEGNTVKEDPEYSILSIPLEKPDAYTAALQSVPIAPAPEKMELYCRDPAGTWSLLAGDVADFDGYWWSQAYEKDKSREWKIKVIKGAAAYDSVTVTDNGEPTALNEEGCYELTPGNAQHVVEFRFRKQDFSDCVRTVLLWPTVTLEEGIPGSEELEFLTDDPLQLYWGKGYPWQYSNGLSTPERTVFATTNQEAYLFSSWLSVTAKNPGILSFDYMVDGSEENDLKIAVEDGNELVTISGKKGWTHLEIPLEAAEGSQTVTLNYTNWDKESTDSYAAFSNMKFETGTAELNLTVKGTGTVTGLQPGANSAAVGSTVKLTAVPGENNQFLGWLDEKNELLSLEAEFELMVREDKQITALFADPRNAVAQAGIELFDTLPEAFDALKTEGGTVRLIRDLTLQENLEVPEKTTLLVPCSEFDTGYDAQTGYNPDGTETSPATGVSPKAKLFKTLTVPEGVTLTVKGTVLVNAVTGRPGAGHYDMDVTGGYGQIELGGEIQIPSGGVLDVCGYVKGGGTVTVKSGGEVRDLYVVRNWRGGSQAFEVFPSVYPMNQADMHNITAETRIEAGGSLVGTVKMYASGSYYYTRFPQVDSKNGLIRLQEGGAAVKTYDAESGREKLALSGGGTVASSTLEIVGMDLSTAGFLYPVDGDMDFELISGDWTVSERLKFMPGAQVAVDNGASLTIAEKTGHDGSLRNQVVFYDSFQPEDPKNTSTTAYPKDRGAAVLTLEGGASLTVNGSFAGKILPGRSASAESPVQIVTGENCGLTVNSLEANGYCNGTRELLFAAGLGTEAQGMAAGEDYLCYYEDGALVVKDRATQSFEGACAALAEAEPPATSLKGEAALIGYITDWTRGLVREEAITVAVELTEGGYVEPEAGTAENPSGTPGSFAFTITLSQEGLEPYTTGVMTLTLVAAPYTPPSSGGGGGSSVTEETVTNPDGSQTTIVTDPGAGTVTETTRGTDGSVAVKVTRDDGSVTESRETASGAHAETEIGADGSVGIEAGVPSTAIENGERSVETAAGTITLPEAAGGETSFVLRVVPSAGGIADIWLEIRVNGVPLSDLSGMQLRIDLKRLLEEKKQLSLRGDGGDAVEAGLRPGLVAVEADRVLPNSYVTGTELVLRGVTGGTLRVEERAVRFEDVPESFWGAGDIAFAAARELLQGTGPAEFSPEEHLTRAMLMTVLARIEGIDTQGTPWYEKGIQWAVETGVSDGSEPHAPITREQLVTMLYRYFRTRSDAVQSDNSATLSGFADGGTVNSWAAEALGWAVERGIVRGKEGNRIDPQGTATRAETAAMLQRFLLLES